MDPALATEHKDRHASWTTLARSILQRLLDVRNGLPPVPPLTRSTNIALSRRCEPLPTNRHVLTWASPSRPMCSLCFRAFRRPSAWREQCTGQPTVGPGALPAAAKHKHNMALFAMAGRKCGLLAMCLRCGAYSQHSVRNLNKLCPGSLGNRLYALRKVLAGRHPADKGTYVQAVLRPWPRSTKQQRDSMGIPARFLRQPAPSASSAPSQGPALSSAVDFPASAHGEGDPHLARPPAPAPVPLEEEWDLDALATWFGDE
jgi:hypothetical protein